MKICLCIVTILVAFVLAQCDEIPPEIMKVFEECGKEHGVPEESWKRPNFNDPKIKCLSACIMKKKDLLVDGKVVPNKVIEFAKNMLGKDLRDAGKELLNKCSDKANEAKEECDVGGAFGECIMTPSAPKQ